MMTTTEEQTGSGSTSSGTNAADLDRIANTIRTSLKAGQSTGMQALTNFRDIGEALNEAKAVFGKGAFGSWTEAEFGFSKEWRARLMKLASGWQDVLKAHDWASSLGRVLGRKEYSVDGALALVKEWTLATDPEAQAEAERKAAERAAKADQEAAEGQDKESETEQLRRMLAEALGRIKALEAEVKAARGGKSEGPKDAPKDPPKGTAKGAEPGPVSAADKGKARKVHALYKSGGTQGEKDAAKDRLDSLAMKCGMDFETFLAACGLEA